MPLQPTSRAPYTTTAAVLSVLTAWRNRGLGLPVTSEVLVRAGVQESLARRTFQSLVDLELLREDGSPTEQFEAFKSTRGEDEYKTRLQEWLRGVYADVLMYADPSTSSFDAMAEAFRTYEPAGQRRSMASLLLGLWRYADLSVASAGNGSPVRLTPVRQTASGRLAARRPASRSASPALQTVQDVPVHPVEPPRFDLDPALMGLLRVIPSGKGARWSQERRDAFLAAFAAVLDYSVQVETFDPFAFTDDDTEGAPDLDDES